MVVTSHCDVLSGLSDDRAERPDVSEQTGLVGLARTEERAILTLVPFSIQVTLFE